MNVQLQINQTPVSVEKGTTLLQAARRYGIQIPTLCDYPGLPAHGSCRMCIVEIQGRPVTPTACTTLAEEGMLVQTHSPKILALRAELLQMLLADHPSSCLFCPEKDNCQDCMVTLKKASVTTGCRSCNKDSQCEIQKLVREFDLQQVDYPGRYRMLDVQRGDPFIDRDNNLCILCGRCVRVCAETHFAPSLAYTKRGSESLVSAAFGETLLAAGCSFCGACVEVCPTGALSEKTRKWDGQPDRETLSTCPFCELGCQIRLLTRGETVIGSLPASPCGELLCVQGRFGITELVNSPTRLVQPQKREGAQSVSAPWEALIALAAQKIAACPPDGFELVISSDCSDEDLYLAHKFAAAIQHRNASPAAPATLPAAWERLAQRAQPLRDFSPGALIVCLGLDGDFSQSPLTSKIHQARQAGARLLWLNQAESRPALFADLWLRPSAGAEFAMLSTLAACLQPASASGQLSPREPQIERAAQMLADAPQVILVVAPGFFQNGPADDTILQLADRLHATIHLAPGEPRWAAPAPLALHAPKVLYLIGESVPDFQGERPWIIYQNIAEPLQPQSADLLLPMAAFTETAGTRQDRFSAIRRFQPAVAAPGSVRPGWQIIAQIARQMGLAGFDFPNLQALQTERTRHPDRQWGNPPASRLAYMGFPLTRWVEGLRWLAPEQNPS